MLCLFVYVMSGIVCGSEGVGPWLAISEALLLLQLGSNLSELLLVQTYLELLRNVLVFVTVGLIVTAPFGVLHVFLHQHTLLDEFRILFSVNEGIMLEVIQVFFDVGSGVFAVVAAIDDIPCGFFSFFCVDSCQLMHFFEMFLQDFSFERCNCPEEASWVACPNFAFLHFHIIFDDCSCGYKTSRQHFCLTNSCSHRHKGTVLEGGTLQNNIGTHKDVVAHHSATRYVGTVLNDRVAAYAYGGGAKNGGAIPNRRVISHHYITKDGCIGCHKSGIFQIGLLSFIYQFAQTGCNAVLAKSIALQLIAHFVETFSSCAEGRAYDLFAEVIEKLVDHHSHQINNTTKSTVPPSPILYANRLPIKKGAKQIRWNQIISNNNVVILFINYT